MSGLSPQNRRQLKARAHGLKPVVQTGAHGLTDAVMAEIDVALDAHELIKIKLAGADKPAREAMIAELGKRLRGHVIGSIGGVVILYRKNKDKAQKRHRLEQEQAALKRKTARPPAAPRKGPRRQNPWG